MSILLTQNFLNTIRDEDFMKLEKKNKKIPEHKKIKLNYRELENLERDKILLRKKKIKKNNSKKNKNKFDSTKIRKFKTLNEVRHKNENLKQENIKFLKDRMKYSKLNENIYNNIIEKI